MSNRDQLEEKYDKINQMNVDELRDMLAQYVQYVDSLKNVVFNLYSKIELLEGLARVTDKISYEDSLTRRREEYIARKWDNIAKKCALSSDNKED